MLKAFFVFFISFIAPRALMADGGYNLDDLLENINAASSFEELCISMEDASEIIKEYYKYKVRSIYDDIRNDPRHKLDNKRAEVCNAWLSEDKQNCAEYGCVTGSKEFIEAKERLYKLEELLKLRITELKSLEQE